MIPRYPKAIVAIAAGLALTLMRPLQGVGLGWAAPD